ncbi:MAG: arylsulfatase [Deltaproteobacteria bacterium]|nr:arylsulfatase [Deltaproteobacteria bacterium]
MLLLFGWDTSTGTTVDTDSKKRPNILLIVADDLGYSDIGAYGGEIPTPNLDSLAASGKMLTSFYAAPTCSPTRAMILSGTDNHPAGLGNMAETLAPNQRALPGYEGYLSHRVVSFVELLADAGYHTYISGKWHLGEQLDHGPQSRGFEESFSLRIGWANHLEPGAMPGASLSQLYEHNGQPVTTFPDDFFSTDFYTDRMIEFIDKHNADGNPFFAYLTYTAPHWPIQAPEKYLAKYDGKYDEGYDVWRSRRFERMKELGLISPDTQLPPRTALAPAWADLSDKKKKMQARTMSAYAAMVDNLDANIGRMFDYLKKIGEYDNTFIIFISDNGAEGNFIGKEHQEPNALESIGRKGSFMFQGPGWGQVSATPFRFWKAFTTEGGIRVPAIFRYPGIIKPNVTDTRFATVMDLAPTILEFAGVSKPHETYRGHPVLPMTGRSMVPQLSGESATHPSTEAIGWELFGRRAIRRGDWKIVWIEAPKGSGEWELYNIVKDPVEQNNLANEKPEIVAEMISLWDDYSTENKIVLPVGPVAY